MSRPPNPAISTLRASCRAATPLTALAPWSVQFRKQMKSTEHLLFRVHKRAAAKTPSVFWMCRSTQRGEETTIQRSVHAPIVIGGAALSRSSGTGLSRWRNERYSNALWRSVGRVHRDTEEISDRVDRSLQDAV